MPTNNGIEPDKDTDRLQHLGDLERQLDTKYGDKFSAIDDQKSATLKKDGLGADQLNNAESGEDESPEEGESLYNPDESDDSNEQSKIRGFLPKRSKASGTSSGRSKRKKLLLAGGGAGGILSILAIGLFLLFFLSGFKSVHFGEILLRSGFARFHFILRERTAQNLFDAALVDGPGTVPRPKTKLRDRLRGIDIEKQLRDFGANDQLRFEFEEKSGFLNRKGGDFKGLRIDGELIAIDDVSKETFKGKSFKDLTLREKMTARKIFTDKVQTGVGKNLQIEGKAARNAVFDNIRLKSGIKMSKWRQKGRDYVGKTPVEADIKNKQDLIDNVSREHVDASSPRLNDTLDDIPEEAKKAIAEDGGKYDPQKAVRNALKNNKVGGLEAAANTVSIGSQIVTLACMINDAASKIEESEEKNQDAAKRMGHDALSGADQIRSGEVKGAAPIADGRLWDQADRSPDYQRAVGKENIVMPAEYNIPATKPKLDPTLISIVQALTSPTNFVLPGATEIPGVGPVVDATNAKVCEGILSPAGQVTLLAVDVALQVAIAVVSGGTGNAAEQALGRAIVTGLGKTLQGAATGIFSKAGLATLGGFLLIDVGLQLSVALFGSLNYAGPESGPEKYGKNHVGLELLQSENLTKGVKGKPLTPQESAAVYKYEKGYLKSQVDALPFQERYFATSNPYSIVSQVAASIPVTSTGIGSVFKNSLFKSVNVFSPQGLASNVASLGMTSGAVYAAGNTSPINHYDVVQRGYSPDEIEKMRTDESYTLENNELWIESHGGLAPLEEKYGKCFAGEKVNDTDKIARENPDCSGPGLSTEPALRYRIYTGPDEYIVKDLEKDFTAIEQASSDTSGAGTTPSVGTKVDPSTLGKSSTNVPCAAGTVDIGEVTSKYTGAYKKQPGPIVLKLCRVTDIPGEGNDTAGVEKAGGAVVSSNVSGAWQALAAQAKKDGIGLSSVSSFRLADSCGGNGDGSSCARPGQSIHQLGAAIDFANAGGKGNSTTSCGPGRMRAPGNPRWEWLLKNAEQYGIKQYSYEAWHWDPLPGANRCGTND